MTNQHQYEALKLVVSDAIFGKSMDTVDDLMELVTAYATTVAQDVIGEDEIEYSNLDGDAGYWEKHGRNGLRAKQRDRLTALQGPQEQDDTPASS